MEDFNKTYYQEQLNSLLTVADSKIIYYNPKLHFSYAFTFGGCMGIYLSMDESNPVLNGSLGLTGALTVFQFIKLISDKLTIRYADKKIQKIEDLMETNGITLDEDGGVIYKENGSIMYVDKDEKEYDITKYVEEVIPGPAKKKNKK